MENYKTIDKNYSGQIVEKKSKFIANVFVINNKEEAENIIKETKKKYLDARHNCFAYIVVDEDNKALERFSDDGEPSGTAGAPIINILRGMELCNVLVIVTRYFGGILLGTGGLVRAYSDATLKALEEVKIVKKEIGYLAYVNVNYSNLENLKYYCRINGIEIAKEEFAEDVKLYLEISKNKYKKMEEDKMKLEITKFDIIQEKHINTAIN